DLAGETRKRDMKNTSLAMTLLTMNQTEVDVKTLCEPKVIGVEDRHKSEEDKKAMTTPQTKATPPESRSHVSEEMNILTLPSKECFIPEEKTSRWWERPELLKDPGETRPLVEKETIEDVVKKGLNKTDQPELSMMNSKALTKRDWTCNETVNMLGWKVRIRFKSRKSPADRVLSPRMSQKKN
ncbi:hypothetical protein, partial [Staphylococcus aureus]